MDQGIYKSLGHSPFRIVRLVHTIVRFFLKPDFGIVSDKLASAHHNELLAQIKVAEKRLAEIAVLRTHIVNYARTRETYAATEKPIIPKNFGKNMRKESCFTSRQKTPLTSWA